MMNGILPKHCGKFAVGFGITGALVYLLMINVTLAHLESVSGHVPFDMRPFGYGPAGAATLLDALGADGRGYYLRYQIPLDTVYPALLAMTLIATICWLARGMPNGRLVRAGVALAVGSALFDYVENLGIVAMIWSWPEVYAPLVYAAGAATIAKSAVTTLAVLLVICLGFVRSRMSRADFRLQAGPTARALSFPIFGVVAIVGLSGPGPVRKDAPMISVRSGLVLEWRAMGAPFGKTQEWWPPPCG